MTEIIVLEYGVPLPPNACPLSQGFWKNKADFWPVGSLTFGGHSYTRNELLELLKMPVRGDASLILAKQLIASKLNTEWGSNPAPVADTITVADDIFSAFNGKPPYRTKPRSKTGKMMTSAAEILDDYNNRLLTPDCNPLAPTLATAQSERDIEVLTSKVELLVSNGSLTKGQGNSLAVKLEGAKLNRENSKAARKALRAFTNQVNAFIGAGILDAEEGLRLMDEAGRIMIQISK